MERVAEREIERYGEGEEDGETWREREKFSGGRIKKSA